MPANFTRRGQPNSLPSSGVRRMTYGPTLSGLNVVFSEVALSILAEIGVMVRLAFETVMWAVRPPYRFNLLVDAMEFIGVQSIFIVGLTGTFAYALEAVDGRQLPGKGPQSVRVDGRRIDIVEDTTIPPQEYQFISVRRELDVTAEFSN